MHELRIIFPYVLNDRLGYECKTDNKYINVSAKFHLCQENIVVLIMEKMFLYFYQKKVLDNLNHLLKTNTKDILNFLAWKNFKQYPWTFERKVMW